MEWSFSLKVPVHRGLGLGSRGCWTGWLAVCLLFPWAMLLSAHLSVVTSPWLCACLGSFIHSMMLTFCCCSVTESCPTLCDPMDCSTPGSPVFHSLPEFAQIHVHSVGAAIHELPLTIHTYSFHELLLSVYSFRVFFSHRVTFLPM